MSKLKVAVIGLGRISIMHLVSINQLEEVELVAVCDVKEERANECASKYNCNAYYDYKEMFEKEKLDAVHICLPHYLHSEVSCYAFSKGVNVLSEKPMDINFENAQKAVDMAREKNLLYGVIFQCRYNNPSKLVKEAVTSGRLGRIISASSILTWTRPNDYYLESDWKGTWDKEGGGVIIDQAIHSIDLVNWLVDSEVESIDCTISNHGHSLISVEDTGEGLITYKNNVKYGFYAMNNYGVDEPIEIKIYCEKGRAVFNYDVATIYYNDGTVEKSSNDENDKFCSDGKIYWGFQHIKQIRQFYNSVLGKETLEISGEEALKTHKLICKIYESGRQRKKITF